jgi:two-component system alkaline phosphatase synthesis response regulator PhoP
MSKTILVIDDEPKIVEICRDYLVAAGFDVITASDGPQGLAAARRERPDLIVLDLMLPGMDGLDVCRELRREGSTPVIMLTARVEESDKLVGLELGADDYLTKPFSPRELVARVRTVLRRASGPAAPAEVIRAGALTLDRARYRARLPDREVALTPTEFEILAALAGQPGRIFSRAQLLTVARGVAFESYERAIDSHIRNLRRKIEPSEGEPRYIITVHGVGYKFAE